MRSFLLAVIMLFALPAWAETRDPATHFFQPKFGDPPNSRASSPQRPIRRG